MPKLFAVLGRQLLRFVSRLFYHLAIQLAVCIFIVASFWIDRMFKKFMTPDEMVPKVAIQSPVVANNQSAAKASTNLIGDLSESSTVLRPATRSVRSKRNRRRIRTRSITNSVATRRLKRSARING